MIADLLHFSFTVSDIERSTAWYTDVLGLELVHTQRQDNEYTRKLVGIPEAVLEVAMFKIPNLESKYSTHILELIQYVAPEGKTLPLATNNVGVAHLALMVDDIHERHIRMAEQGVQFRNPPVEIMAGTNKGGWACYLHDPDGITIELLEPSPQRQIDLGMQTSVTG
jgi:lactoylglutathione lyase